MTRRTVAVLALALAAGPSPGQPGFTPAGTTRASIESSIAFKQYTEPAIQADLKLTDEQKARIAKIPDELLTKHKDAIEKEQAANKEAAEKSAARAAEIQTKVDALLEKHLTTPQRKRLQQMAVQMLGYTTFTNPEVAKALAITDDQKAKFAEMRAEGLEKANSLLPNGGFGIVADSPDLTKYMEASRKIAQETVAKMVETLTADQKKAWADLAGEPSEAVKAATAARATSPFATSFRALGLAPPASFNSTIGRQLTLIQNEKALAELKLDKSAADALTAGWKAIADETRAAAGNGPAGPGGRGGVGRIQFTISSEAAKLAGEVLTAPQAKRLEQIQLQLSGLSGIVSFGAASRVLGKLTLTPAQAAKIDAVLADANTQTQSLGRRPSPARLLGDAPNRRDTPQQVAARKEYEDKVRAIEQKALADVLGTFDAGQAMAWKELTGEPFDTTAVSAALNSNFGFGLGRGTNTTTVASLWASEGLTRQNQGNYAAALAAADEAIRMAPAEPRYQLQKATLLATCPSEMVRDGKAALELARKVVAAKKEPTAGDYAVLAAAHAEAGQFEEAIATQEKAIAALPPPRPTAENAAVDRGGFGGPANAAQRAASVKSEYEARLQLYRAKQPARMELPRSRRPVTP